ncbi:MAG TPA: cobyric acid synthase [Nitrospirales bacterium]|nr:cobyric acid synthase [Nitrospirales bacterium]
MSARSLMIQGTGSHVGKTVMVAALCRIFAQDGHRVAPFKAQNMALNSYVTWDGKEIGRAQAVQAQAAGIIPTVLMNPILIKPNTDTSAQVIVMGIPIGDIDAREYGKNRAELMPVIADAYAQLSKDYDVVIIEGAGSPAEINLRDRDIVNMDVAEMANAPVLLVGDIDNGGVFAWFVGTLQLLSPDERDRVCGFIINKFRGDRDLLQSGLDFLERKTGKKVFGVIPYFRDIAIPEEDSLQGRLKRGVVKKDDVCVRVGILELPHISNFTDFDPLDAEPDVRVQYMSRPEELSGIDALIIPGTKNTIGDLEYLYEFGFAERVCQLALRGATIIGICGGYQMLGQRIEDPHCTESAREAIQGLGLLDVETSLAKEKTTLQVEGMCVLNGTRVHGYEIHHGETILQGRAEPFFTAVRRQDVDCSTPRSHAHDGARTADGKIWGTTIHALFENFAFRRAVIDDLRRAKGLTPRSDATDVWNLDQEYNKLAELVRAHLDLDAVGALLRK